MPFTFFGLFVMVEFWGEIEPASYVAGAFSTLAVVCAFVLSFLPLPAAAVAAAPEPSPTPSWPPSTPALPAAGWYPDPGGVHHQRYWDGERWTAQTN